ncbi:MAG: DNA polymerase III subunit delta [Acidimicrobiia bacterium]|nr:DNA polymerase III subunit delta [Acidimicrobiia bacterium]MDH5224453.1 DNA polymerase III subunit delta [Actinomycetota bacterium]MDH5314121.1 DNA polymerase III subunit delta [Actinomycetota bacterium]
MPARPRTPIALLWGEDAFLLREAALARLGDVHPIEVDAGQWQGGELQNLATPSLFGEPRALLVSDARSLTKDAIGELARYLDAPDPDAQLVICCQVAERGKVPAALDKVVKPVGEVVHVEIKRKDLEPWLTRRADALGLDLSVPAARALVETLGEEPGQLVAALQQLSSAFPGQRVTPATVATQFRGLGEQKVWDLCDRAFSRDLPGAIRSWRSLEESGDDALKVLGGVSSRLRDLIRVRSLPDRMPPADLAKAAGLRFDWQAKRYRQQAGNFSLPQLLALHERVAEVDRALKSGATGETVMPALVVAIAAS